MRPWWTRLISRRQLSDAIQEYSSLLGQTDPFKHFLDMQVRRSSFPPPCAGYHFLYSVLERVVWDCGRPPPLQGGGLLAASTVPATPASQSSPSLRPGRVSELLWHLLARLTSHFSSRGVCIAYANPDIPDSALICALQPPRYLSPLPPDICLRASSSLARKGGSPRTVPTLTGDAL